MTTAHLLGAACWSFALVGLVVAARGGWYQNVIPVAFGMCLLFYSLTGENYVPLTDPGRSPLTTPERTWGATSAVLGGCACVGVMMALRQKEQRDAGLDEWTDSRLQRRLLFLVLLASVSIAAINMGLSRYNLAPSSNFLTDYGRLPGVVVYEIVFAAWIMIPVGTLGWTAFKAPRIGPARWLVAVGGLFGVIWGAWKIAGVIAILTTGSHVADESPVSVALGLSTLTTNIVGVVACVAYFLVVNRRGSQWYQRQRDAEDAYLRRSRFGRS